MTKIYQWLTLSSLLFITAISYAQTNSNSPYSYFGLGEIETANSDRTAGMGGVGIGIKSRLWVNNLNPASYSSIDSLFFLFDVNLFGTTSKFESRQNSYVTMTGNINKLALGFRLSRKMAASIGLSPFSSVSYKINSRKAIEGGNDYFDILSKGEGGLNKVYFGSSYKVNEHNSIGINGSFLFGSILRSEKYTYSYFTDSYWQVTEKIIPKPNLYFDFGYQYTNSLNSKTNYTIGLIGGINTKMKFSKYTINETDTTLNAAQELKDKYSFWIPAYFGLGFSVNSERWTVAADYRLQKWGSTKLKNDLKYLTDSYRFAAGIEYSPNKRLGKKLIERMSYQAGFHYEKSYLTINSVNIGGYGATLGFGIPVRNQLSSINISFEAGLRGNYSRDLFRERYCQVNISVNMNDLWFLKRKFK